MERKRRIEVPGQGQVDVTEVGFRSDGEYWNEYLLDDGTMARPKLVQRWVRAAVAHHVVRSISDPDGYVATVAGIDGAWGFGDSPEEARDELESVLIGWVSLKLEDGDDDIPNMEGVHLVARR